MYQPYPSGGKLPKLQRPAAPASVVNAVKLMYAGAAVVVVYAIVSLATLGSMKAAVHRADTKLTPQQLNGAEGILVGSTIIYAVVVGGLWLLMAWANSGPRSWARIVASVLFGLNTLYMIVIVAAAHSIGSIFPVANWLIGAAALYLLWRPDSTAFYNAPSA